MTRRDNPKPADRPVVRLKPSNYRPSRAELEEPIILRNPDGSRATPEQALKALVTPVRIVRESE